MKKKEEIALNGNLTAMIDVVFQLIIFFVATVALQDANTLQGMDLAMAPHGKAKETKDPMEITVDVDRRGKIFITRTPLSQSTLRNVIKAAVQNSRGKDVPVIIRADVGATHNTVRTVMDTVAEAGVWKIKIAALKESAEAQQAAAARARAR